MSWIGDKFPSKKMERKDVLVKRKMVDGSIQVRIGYVRYMSDGPFFVVPKYDREPVPEWEVVGWQLLPD